MTKEEAIAALNVASAALDVAREAASRAKDAAIDDRDKAMAAYLAALDLAALAAGTAYAACTASCRKEFT